MKRAEIKLGDELYYDRSADWAAPAHDSAPCGRRAVVVDLGPFKINRDEWGWPDSYRPDPAGNAVLVEVSNLYGNYLDRMAVPIAHLRGPWAEVYSRVEVAITKRRAAAAELVARAGRAGWNASAHDFGHVLVPVSEFARILDRLEGS